VINIGPSVRDNKRFEIIAREVMTSSRTCDTPIVSNVMYITHSQLPDFFLTVDVQRKNSSSCRSPERADLEKSRTQSTQDAVCKHQSNWTEGDGVHESEYKHPSPRQKYDRDACNVLPWTSLVWK
jgi:hypothetical protein